MRAFAGLLLALIATTVQAAPSMSFSVATGNTPHIVWDCGVGATGATASGSWTGAQPVSGAFDAPAITDTVNYGLSCLFGGKTSVDLSYTAPTKNTDGSPLTDLAGFKVYRGTTAANLTLLTTIASPTTLTYKDTGLPPGTWFYAVSAYTTAGVESVRSAVGSAVTTATSTLTASVKITVPAAPSGGTVN